MTPSIALIDAHWLGDNSGRRKTWEHARLEEMLSRAFNRELLARLRAADVRAFRVNSDSLLSESVRDHFLHKLACCVGHEPRADIAIETHWNRAPPGRNGMHVQVAENAGPYPRTLAMQIARGMARGLKRSGAYPIVCHPAPGYRQSGLFGELWTHAIPLVLVELPNLDNPRLRLEAEGRNSKLWVGLIDGVADAVETWASGLWAD